MGFICATPKGGGCPTETPVEREKSFNPLAVRHEAYLKLDADEIVDS